MLLRYFVVGKHPIQHTIICDAHITCVSCMLKRVLTVVWLGCMLKRVLTVVWLGWKAPTQVPTPAPTFPPTPAPTPVSHIAIYAYM